MFSEQADTHTTSVATLTSEAICGITTRLMRWQITQFARREPSTIPRAKPSAALTNCSQKCGRAGRGTSPKPSPLPSALPQNGQHTSSETTDRAVRPMRSPDNTKNAASSSGCAALLALGSRRATGDASRAERGEPDRDRDPEGGRHGNQTLT